MAAATLAMSAAIWITQERAPEEPQVTVRAPLAEAPPQAEPSRQPAPSPAVPAPPAAAERSVAPRSSADPAVREFEQRLQFQQRVRTFFAQAPALPPAEKTARARVVAQEITRYEAAGEIAAAEAFMLRAALIRETVADPAEQVEGIAALQEHYRQQGRSKQAEWDMRVDPQFELYKAREREIVAEVMSLTRIPDGLSREEYLRRRLQGAREMLTGAN